MTFDKIKLISKRLEDPQHPLLGPNIKGLFWFGIWYYENKSQYAVAYLMHFLSLLFVIGEFIELYFLRHDIMTVLFNISVTALGLVSISKAMFLHYRLPHWKALISNISSEEIAALKEGNETVVEIMRYRKYSRTVTYLYWSVVLLTNIVIILSPFLPYFTSASYRETIRNGTEPYPQIVSSWLPFDKTMMPGYLGAIGFHTLMICRGAGVVASYDANAIAIMSFLKGQLQILKYKCSQIFGDDNPNSKEQVLINIRECHRLHTFFIRQYALFNSILSPVMFIYVLVCSIMICCSVVQLCLGETTVFQKLWVVEYTCATSVQLFLYCWHSNEIAYESIKVDLGLYQSNWWRSDVNSRKQILMLAGKLAPSFILNAGPFTTFSMATFIEIMKGSYSFYTLFTQMREK